MSQDPDALPPAMGKLSEEVDALVSASLAGGHPTIDVLSVLLDSAARLTCAYASVAGASDATFAEVAQGMAAAFEAACHQRREVESSPPPPSPDA